MDSKDSVQRKIQLVGGVSYSVSLPKAWVIRHHLKEGQTISTVLNHDGTLTVFPGKPSPSAQLKEFSFNVDHYKEDVGQALFVPYYLGFEDIIVFSKTGSLAGMKSRIKDTLRFMAGTETIYEDEHKIHLRVLLDKEKVVVPQLFYRMGLLIASSIDLLEKGDFPGVDQNEHEIDRLYHLVTKTVIIAQNHSGVLDSSGIGHTHFLTPFLLIAKKLENMSDSLFHLSLYLKGHPDKKKSFVKPLAFLKEKLMAGVLFLMNQKKPFVKTDRGTIQKFVDEVEQSGDLRIITHIDDAFRYLVDVEEELTHLSFFSRLIEDKVV